MKTIYKYIIVLITFGTLVACDDQIHPNLDTAPPILVIDAWVNDKMETQVINVSMSLPYLDNSPNQNGVSGAEVYIVDNENTRFDFIDAGNGDYMWTPVSTEGFGTIGNDYSLFVNVNGESFESISHKNRVPLVDSVSFRYVESGFGYPDIYVGEFFSRDLLGTGDTYWIKSYKNEAYLGKPSEINIAFDAGFTEGGAFDDIVFIPPLREAVNPFEEDPDDETQILSPYVDGDSLYVEIHSLTKEAFTFLNELRAQTDREGGFAELFSSPLSNVRSNITCVSNPNLELVGFFCVSAVEGNGKRLDIAQVPKD